MEYKTITAVGIDVSKGKSTVAVRRPGGEVVLTPFQVEHTGMYWRPIALALKEAGFFVSVVNAMLIHDFSDNSLRKVKTDRADSMKIANYALSFWAGLRDYLPEDETRQMLKMQSRLYLRTKKSSVVLRNGLISLLPEFDVVMAMQGAGEITGPQLMAEIGDVRRFSHKGALVAFAGMDAPPFQSGTFDS